MSFPHLFRISIRIHKVRIRIVLHNEIYIHRTANYSAIEVTPVQFRTRKRTVTKLELYSIALGGETYSKSRLCISGGLKTHYADEALVFKIRTLPFK